MTDRPQYASRRGKTDRDLAEMSSDQRVPGAWFTTDQATHLVFLTIVVGAVGAGALLNFLVMNGPTIIERFFN